MVKMRIVFLVFIVAALAPFIAKAATFQETLNQYIFDLQKNPNDNALREKIIKHVQEMEPKPAIPVEAEKFEGRAEFAIKSAKSEADFLDAAKEYEKALQIAPWMPAYYFNLGIAYEKGGKPKEAKRSFEFYLLAAPTASDAREVRKRIAGLEYASEKTAREPSKPSAIEAKQDPFENMLRKIDGRRYTLRQSDVLVILDVKGRILEWGYIENGVYHELGGSNHHIEIKGRETTVPVYDSLPITIKPVSNTFTISDDGSWIKCKVRYSDGDFREFIYLWQR
jgi:tetratricopeptide (TPR) repeat protein